MAFGRRLLVLSVIVLLLAVFSYKLYNRLFNIPVPENFPENSVWQFQMMAFTMEIMRDMASVGSALGLGSGYVQSMRQVLLYISSMHKNETHAKLLDVNDTEIFGTKVRIYRPLNNTTNENGTVEKKLLPAVVYYHGGGWVIGSVGVQDSFCSSIALEANVIVISAHYRQAPEYIYPAQFNDCYNVAVGVLNTGAKYGIDVKRVIIAGDSAGGNLAAAVTQTLAEVLELHCRKQVLAGQLLLYPVTQLMNFSLPSYQQNVDNLVLSQRDTVMAASMLLTGTPDIADTLLSGNHSQHLRNTTYASYLGLPVDWDEIERKEKAGEETKEPEPLIDLPKEVFEALTNTKASPLMAKNIRGTPPTFIVTAEFDPYRDDGVLYGQRLYGARVPLKQVNYRSFHGFLNVGFEGPMKTEEGAMAFEDVVKFLKDVTAIEKNEDKTES